MKIEMDPNGPQEDWTVVKPEPGRPWFAQDKHSKRKVIVASDLFEDARIEHRRQRQVSMETGVGPQTASVLTAKLDGVVVYIKGDEIVIARAPKTIDGIIHTNVII